MRIYQFKITQVSSKEFKLTLKALGDSIIRTNNLLRFHFIFILGIALWMSLSPGFPDEVLFTYLSTYFTYLLILLIYRKLYDLSAKVSAYFFACNLLPFLSSLLKNASLYVLCVCIYLYICFQYGFP